MQVELRDQPFDPWRELTGYQRERLNAAGEFGATVAFVGTMRDFNEGDMVTGMTLEHYPEMTERHLREIAETALSQWNIIDVLIIHRVGQIFPEDPIVLVAVWSSHRAAAYDANRFIMEDLKSKAPFWKKEQTSKGERWVKRNTPG